jgi:hypothetical protein
MEISKTALGIVAAVCIGAGAGGVYVATRTDTPATSRQGIDATVPLGATTGTEPSSETATAPAPPRVEKPQRPEPAPAPRARRVVEPPKSARTRVAEATVTSQPAPAPHAAPAATPAPVRPPLQATRVADTPVTPVAVPEPQSYDLVIPADAVIGLQVDSSISTETARVEDRVTARVTRDVKVADYVAVPEGARAEGEVTLVERGGRLKDRARLGVRFTSLVLADGTRVPIDTETIYRVSDNPTPSNAAKIGGGAIGGAILGGIFGGAKGAVLGGTLGGGAGTAAVMAGGRHDATLASGSPITIRLQQPATVTVERK